MNIINSIVAYFMYFISPKVLMRRSFIGNLLHFNIRLPAGAVDEILDYLYDIYIKNKKIDKIMKRGGMTTNMERMWDLIQYQAFFIKDLLGNTHVSMSGHEAVLDILKKYQIYGENKKESTSLEILYFKDNEAAFEMVCKYMDTDIVQDKPVIAISMQEMKKPSEPIMIKVAGDPPFHAHTATHYTGDHLIKKGDLLGVMPFTKTEHVTSYMENDERKQWLFLVTSELNPKFHTTKQMWSIKKDFLREAAAQEKSQNKQ